VTRPPAQLLLYRDRRGPRGALVAHALDDAVVRSGGTELGNEFVHATELRAELLSDLAARG